MLHGLSFEVAPGKTIGIVGRSGSGKSTLAKLLQRLYLPDEGPIAIDGVDIRQVDPASLRRQIGVVLQDNLLFSGSVRENISLHVPGAGIEAIIDAAKLAGAHDFVPGSPPHAASSRHDFSPLERQFLPPLLEIEETPPSPLPRAVLAAIVALTAMTIGWACIGEIDVVATAPGRVIPDGKVKVLQSMDNAIIRAIHVKEGQRVKQGDLLVELDPTISGADLTSSAEKLVLTQLELARLRSELSGGDPDYGLPGAKPESVALQEALRAARDSSYRAKLAEARNELQGRTMTLAAAQDTLRKLEETTRTARDREKQVRPYVGHVMPRFEYLKLKDSLTENANDLAAQMKHVQAARETQLAAEHKVRQIEEEQRTRIVAEINDKTAVLATLKGEVDKARQLVSQKELRAPVDGQVQRLAITTAGGVVTPAQTLAVIVPRDTPLIVEAMLSNEDIGFVGVGQRVELKIDTFPFQKYGTLPATVSWVSPDAEEKARSADPSAAVLASDDIAPSKAGLMYRLRIVPERAGLTIGGRLQPIAVGMTVQADIVTDRRKIIEFFLSPVVKYWDEGLKVR